MTVMDAPIAFVGMTTIDVVQVADEFPHRDQKGRAHHAYVDVGGPAANAAITAATLGSPSVLHSVFGVGSMGVLVDSLFDAFAVSRVVYDHREDLPVSSIWVSTSTGERMLLSTAAAFAGPKPDAVALGDVTALLLDGFYPDLARLAALTAAEQGIPIVLDCGTWRDIFSELLPLAAVAIVSEQFEAPEMAGRAPIDVTARLVDRYSLDLAAVSRGSEPIVWATPQTQGELPIPQTDAVDTMGAGDVLHGAFMHFAYGQSLGHLSALESAAAVASESCRYFGTRTGVATRAKTR